MTTDLEVINNQLTQAKAYGLEAEVVMTALMAMRRDPSLTIQEAIYIGYFDAEICSEKSALPLNRKINSTTPAIVQLSHSPVAAMPMA